MHTNMNRYGVDGVARVRELEAELGRLRDENARLEARGERLREALQEIIAEGYDGDFAVEAARNALGMPNRTNAS